MPAPVRPTISGSLSGLSDGSILLLENNGGDKLTVSKNGTFTFATPIAFNSTYAVTIDAHPLTQRCSITNGSGTNVQADVLNVAVACTAAKESIVHHFNNTDGAGPMSELTLGPDGNLYGLTSEGGAFNHGTVFKLTPAGAVTVLHSFAGSPSDGAKPMGAGLTVGADGNFYGVTAFGGTAGNGTFFKLTPSGVHTVLYSFAGGANDAGLPMGTLKQASDGNFYGTSFEGGPAGIGTVFKITPAGVATVLHAFAGTPTDGAYPSGSLNLGTDGNFYALTQGGAASTGAVIKITPAGATSVLYSFANDGIDGVGPNGTLVTGRDGNFYGTTSGGGTAHSGTFFKIDPAGVKTTLYSFAADATDGAEPTGRLLMGKDGNFYGVTTAGGPKSNGIIFMLTPAGVKTTLHSFDPYGGDGYQVWAGLTLGADGYLYGVTQLGGTSGYGTIYKY